MSGAARWVAGLLQAADSLYPTGAYAHSFGLEGLVQDGTVATAGTFREFLLGQALPAAARTDLPLAARALAAVAAPQPDWEEFGRCCLMGSALRGAREPREAAEAIARQRLELAARLHGGVAAEAARRSREAGWPATPAVSAAVEAAALGAPCDALFAALIYGAAAGHCAAAVKLLRLGQNALQGILTEAMDRVPEYARTALELGPAAIGSFNPWWDIAACRHEAADFRLFIS